MPSYSAEAQALHIAYIRRIMLIKGTGLSNRGRDVSVLEIQRQLAENNLMLDYAYITKLKRKIMSERVKNVDAYTREQLKRDLTHVLTAHLETAYEILHSKRAKDSDKVAAMRELRETYCAIYDRTIDLKSFEENMKTSLPAANPTFVISEPKLIAVVDAMIRFGVLPSQSHERALEVRPAAGPEAPGTPQSGGQ